MQRAWAFIARGAVGEVRDRADSAVVAQVNHHIGKRLERVVNVTDAFKAQQQTAELENHLAGLPPPPFREAGLK